MSHEMDHRVRIDANDIVDRMLDDYDFAMRVMLDFTRRAPADILMEILQTQRADELKRLFFFGINMADFARLAIGRQDPPDQQEMAV